MPLECAVCGRPATARCRVCGRPVCPEHVGDDGVCVVCKSAMCRICGRRLAVGYCIVCGRLGCDQCLVQVDNVRRVCRDCLPRWRRGLIKPVEPYMGPRTVAVRLLGALGG